MTTVSVIHAAFRENLNDAPVLVALVECGDREGDAALEYAFHRTNNIMGSWSRPAEFEWDGEMIENPDYSPDVTVMAELPTNRDGRVMGLRSTSVGDHMVLGNTKYIVDHIGFKELV